MYFVYELNSMSAKFVDMDNLTNRTVSLDVLFELCKTNKFTGIDIGDWVSIDGEQVYDISYIDLNDYSGFMLYDYSMDIISLNKGDKIPISLYFTLTDLDIINKDIIISSKGKAQNYLVWLDGISGVLLRSYRVRAVFIDNGKLMAVRRKDRDSIYKDCFYETVELKSLLVDVKSSTKMQFLLREIR